MAEIIDLYKPMLLVEDVAGFDYLTERRLLEPLDNSDHEHLYREVHEGIFYPTSDKGTSGYFHDTESNEWRLIVKEKAVGRWFESRKDVQIHEQRVKLFVVKMDEYVDPRVGTDQYYAEDGSKVMSLLESVSPCQMLRYKNCIFVIKTNEENTPITLYAITKTDGVLKLDELLVKE